MKKRDWKSLLLWCFVVGIILFLPTRIVKAEKVAEALPSPVAISDFEINSHIVQPGDEIKYSFTLTETSLKEFVEKYGEENDIYDENPSIYKFVITWKSPKKQRIKHVFYWKDSNNTNRQLKVSENIPVMKGMQSGTWMMDKIEIYCSEESSFLILDERKQGKHYGAIKMDFSMADFTVTGTGKADNKAPTIDLKSLKLSKRYVKRNQKSTFQVKVKDATKIKRVTCTWWLYEKSNRAWGDRDWSKTYKMTYNKKKKAYQCFVKMDTKYYKKMIPHCITVQDIYGNEEFYSVNYRYIPKSKKKYYKAYKKMVIRKK